MSFLVAMARAHYHDNAFDAFTASSGYSLENARAMMWMSQLAYDTDDRPKVESVLDAWGLGLRAFVTNNPITGFPLGAHARLSRAAAPPPSCRYRYRSAQGERLAHG